MKTTPPKRLSVEDHSRDSVGLCYVYPVISRRAGGVSIGINLNVNNACNWACVYCQVPNLTRGAPPPVYLPRLERELRFFLHETATGDFMRERVPSESRKLVDVAFSGNGEPTSAPGFLDAVVLLEGILCELSLEKSLKMRLITNGSLTRRPEVQKALARIGARDGEVWFKLDRGSAEGILRVNGARVSMQSVRESLCVCADLAPTWIQTCYFSFDGKCPGASEEAAYLEFIASVRKKIKGVLLYGIARPSMQADKKKLSQAPLEEFRRFSQQIASLGAYIISNP
jgi:wyosine [tRNA(Phe)-imidazoG37] synthetase (radical SAM superfamily)